MRIILVLALLLSASALRADEVVTVEGHTFPGIVVSFDLDKAVVLSTGFGNLTFGLPDAVRDVRKSDYEWPRNAVHAQPERCEDFLKWLQAKADEKADPEHWEQVPRALAENELDPRKMLEAAWNHMHGQADSVEQARARRQLLNDSWAYLALEVESVAVSTERGVERITLTLNGDFLDVRTGRQIVATRDGGREQQVRVGARSFTARDDLSQEEVDRKNQPGGWATYIDYALAEKLRAGNLVVFRYRFDVEAGEERLEFVRIKPRANSRRR
jgi:hypothetical protein